MTFINTYTTKLAGVFYSHSKFLLAAAGILLLPLLIACTLDEDLGQDDTYTIGGAVTGHTGEVSLTLTYGDDYKTETLEVFQGGENFAFESKLLSNQSFTIAISAPRGQNCSSSLTKGTIVDGNITTVEITCNVGDTYSVSGTVNGAADNTQITITLSHGYAGSPPDNIISENVTPDTTDGTFSFDVPENRVYLITVASDTTREVCTTAATAYSDPVTANVTGADITCSIAAVNTYSIGGAITRADTTSTIYVVLTVSDDNAGAGATNQSITVNATDGTFSFTGVSENKFYTLKASSSIVGETCTSSAATPTQITANVTGAQVTCTAPPAGFFLRIQLVSFNDETSLTTVNVFIGDTAIPATTGTPDQVVNGNADVIIVPVLGAFFSEGYLYDIPIDANKYYAVTVTTTSGTENCTVGNGGSGGPISRNMTAQIICDLP